MAGKSNLLLLPHSPLTLAVGSYTYNIPKCISNGEYLLRIQSLAIHNPWPAGIPQVNTLLRTPHRSE